MSSTIKIKSFLSSFFSKKLAVSKGRAFGRSNERNGGVGACPRPSIVPKKFFGNLFIKKGWAAESRLMKLPANHNGRPKDFQETAKGGFYMNKPDEKDKKTADEKLSVSQDNNDNDDVKSWAEEAKQDLEDFIESQGIYISQ